MTNCNTTADKLAADCSRIADELTAIAEGRAKEHDGQIITDEGQAPDGTDWDDLEDVTASDWLSEALSVRGVVELPGMRLNGVMVSVTVGGPGIWVDTYNLAVKGSWGSDEVSVPIPFETACAIDEAAAEIFAMEA